MPVGERYLRNDELREKLPQVEYSDLRFIIYTPSSKYE